VCSHSYYSENLNWAAQNLRLGRGLDIAGLEPELPIAKKYFLQYNSCQFFEAMDLHIRQ